MSTNTVILLSFGALIGASPFVWLYIDVMRTYRADGLFLTAVGLGLVWVVALTIAIFPDVNSRLSTPITLALETLFAVTGFGIIKLFRYSGHLAERGRNTKIV